VYVLGNLSQTAVNLGENLGPTKIAARHLELKIVAHPSHMDVGLCLVEAETVLGNHREGAEQMQAFGLGLHFAKALVV